MKTTEKLTTALNGWMMLGILIAAGVGLGWMLYSSIAGGGSSAWFYIGWSLAVALWSVLTSLFSK